MSAGCTGMMAIMMVIRLPLYKCGASALMGLRKGAQGVMASHSLLRADNEEDEVPFVPETGTVNE